MFLKKNRDNLLIFKGNTCEKIIKLVATSNPLKKKNNFKIKDNILLAVKTTDIVSGGAWGRRPHTISEPTMLVSYF